MNIGAVHMLCEHAARTVGVPVDEFLARTHAQAKPRYAVMYVARHRYGYSYERIGRYMDGRDHSTILEGVARAAERIFHDDKFAALVRELEGV